MSDAQQSLLPLAEEAEVGRRALVRGAVATLGLRAGQAREAEALLLYLDAADKDNSGCRSYLETIGGRLAADGLAMSERTLQRRLAILREAGAVVSWWHKGRVRNRVAWDEIRRLAFGQRQPANAAARPPRGAESSRADDAAPNRAVSAAPTTRQAAPNRAVSAAPTPRQVGVTPRQVGVTPRQVGVTPRQVGVPNGRSLGALLGDLLGTPPPQVPRNRCAPTAWREEEEFLRASGFSVACRAVGLARSRGLTPADLRAIAATLLAHRDRWRRPEAPLGAELGVLFLRLSEARPGQDWGDLSLWPPATAAHRQRAESRARWQASDERRRAESAARDAADDEHVRLEAAHAAALDALERDALDALAAGLPAILRPHYRRDGLGSSLVRGALLDLFASRGAPWEAPP